MIRPVLFFDVDGVLNSYKRSFDRGPDRIRLRAGPVEPDCVEQLSRVKTETGCLFVMSSSWRHVPDVVAEFARVLEVQVHGLTGTASYRDADHDFHSCRGLEILNFLVQHHDETTPYAVIDDESADILLPCLIPEDRFVHVSDHNGMKEEHADRLIEILRTPIQEPSK